MTGSAGGSTSTPSGPPPHGSVNGGIEITANDLGARVGDLAFSGDLRIRTRLEEGMPLQRRFDISGTRIDIDGVRVIRKGITENEGWWARIVLPEAKMVFTTPGDVEAQLVVTMKDTGPLVALFEARKHVSRFVKGLLTIDNIEVDAVLAREVFPGRPPLIGGPVDCPELRFI